MTSPNFASRIGTNKHGSLSPDGVFRTPMTLARSIAGTPNETSLVALITNFDFLRPSPNFICKKQSR